MVRPAAKPEKDDKEKKVTFVAKESTRCPVCDAVFKREELFSGRLNAGDLTDELHRTYIPMQAYGEVHPLVYELSVCPSCWYAAFKSDFAEPPQKTREALQDGISARVEAAQRLFEPLDFSSARDLLSGAASYYLAMLSYERFPKDYAPVVKQGLCSLRAAWLCAELERHRPGENFGYSGEIFHRKARFLYRHAVDLDQKGTQQLAQVKWLGPDTDKNYGYEGVLYLKGVLELKYGQRGDAAKRLEALESSKRAIAKMFGLGKRSKSKPGPLLDKARDLYDRIKAELDQDDDEADD
ncbi:MAG: DUF2225 domain-containing protein [Spirochaetaceae bacterium]|nr:DUF2225 domain-containing protein [Spirochaetaceae bacterium]